MKKNVILHNKIAENSNKIILGIDYFKRINASFAAK